MNFEWFESVSFKENIGYSERRELYILLLINLIPKYFEKFEPVTILK